MPQAPASSAGSSEYRVRIDVPVDHPSLAGHFPGHPMVPGVLLLDRVLDAAAAWPEMTPEHERGPRLPQVKFLAPMHPGLPAEVVLERAAGKLRFRIEQDGRVLVQGVFA